jgi:hypothetical protein
MEKPAVFISYSHKDEQWKDLLRPHLKMLGDDRIAIWDDRKIDPGGEWFVEIQLEWARLCLARGERDQAREHWATAKAMVEQMSYHRRDREVEEIARELGETA